MNVPTGFLSHLGRAVITVIAPNIDIFHFYLSEFADFGGHEKLSNALLTVQDILFDMEFNAPKKQSVIGDYFHPHV